MDDLGGIFGILAIFSCIGIVSVLGGILFGFYKLLTWIF